MVWNQAAGFHHVNEPGWNYQVKLKLFARTEVLNSTLFEVDTYFMPGLKLGRNPRQVYGWAAEVPEVPEEYPVD